MSDDLFKDFVAGQCAGMAKVVVGHPLDTIKVVMQTQSPALTTTACCRHILVCDGVLGFFQGMLAPLLVRGSINATLFAVFGATAQKLAQVRNRAAVSELSFADLALCGAVAGVSTAPLSGPTELIKSQLQVQRGRGAQYVGTVQFTLQLLRAHGAAPLARGLGATVVREAPAYAAYYSVYYAGKRQLVSIFPGEGTLAVQVPAAQLAGIAYWTCCYPIDVAKSVMQTEPLCGSPQHRNVVAAIRAIVDTQGPTTLLKGIGPCYLRTLIAAPATFVTYEAVRSFL
jgi:solute carrier family 25 carnitine/acylcarnitine transporter 20/29